MSTTIKLRATAPLLYGGTLRVRGGIIFADLATARELISTGRAKLDDPNDLVQLTSAEQEHTTSVCRDSAVYRVPRGWATR